MSNLLKLYPDPTEIKPKIQIINQIPKDLKPRAIERAVMSFVWDSHVKGDPLGVFRQTLETIANSTFLNGAGNVWMATNEGEVVVYIIARTVKEIDNKLTYWVSQAWVHKDFRGKPIVKEWWANLKDYAKKHFCEHLVIVSSRNPKAYTRWFGTDMKEYATLMMEDLT